MDNELNSWSVIFTLYLSSAGLVHSTVNALFPQLQISAWLPLKRRSSDEESFLTLIPCLWMIISDRLIAVAFQRGLTFVRWLPGLAREQWMREETYFGSPVILLYCVHSIQVPEKEATTSKLVADPNLSRAMGLGHGASFLSFLFRSTIKNWKTVPLDFIYFLPFTLLWCNRKRVI